MSTCIEFSCEAQVKSLAAIKRQDREMLTHSLAQNSRVLGYAWLRETLALAGVERISDLPLPMLRVLAHTAHRAEWLIFLSDWCADTRAAATKSQ